MGREAKALVDDMNRPLKVARKPFRSSIQNVKREKQDAENLYSFASRLVPMGELYPLQFADGNYANRSRSNHRIGLAT
jgi:hypothetical protein